MPDFVVKDSGVREEYSTGMRRDTQDGKARFSLIVPACLPYDEQMLARWAMLMTNGAKKYGERNWEKARTPEELKRFRDSAFRHFMQWFTSADHGKDQEEDHAAAVMFNIGCAEYVWWHLNNPGARHPGDSQPEQISGPQPGDVIFHQHDFPDITYYLPEDEILGVWSAHSDMKPHRHDVVDGKTVVIPL